MSRRREPQQANLFELEIGVEEAPLGDEPDVDVTDAVAEAERARAERRRPRVPVADEVAAPDGIANDDVAGFGRRMLGGVLDVMLQALVALGSIAGAQALGAAPVPRALPGFALLVLVFSLVYTVVPLAFWGRTPGMRALGLVAHTGDEHPLTFAEAFRRWLAGLLTLALAGLPGLLALGRAKRSLADRWSGSRLVGG